MVANIFIPSSRGKQVDLSKSKARLVYTASSNTARVTSETLSQEKKVKKSRGIAYMFKRRIGNCGGACLIQIILPAEFFYFYTRPRICKTKQQQKVASRSKRKLYKQNLL